MSFGRGKHNGELVLQKHIYLSPACIRKLHSHICKLHANLHILTTLVHHILHTCLTEFHSFQFPMLHYEADLTTTQVKDSACDWCRQIYPAGTKLHYMQDRKHPNKPGYSCHDYYLSKPTTCCVNGLLKSIFPITDNVVY